MTAGPARASTSHTAFRIDVQIITLHGAPVEPGTRIQVPGSLFFYRRRATFGAGARSFTGRRRGSLGSSSSSMVSSVPGAE